MLDDRNKTSRTYSQKNLDRIFDRITKDYTAGMDQFLTALINDD